MAATPMSAPDSGVKVRMYRQGLGDCFLLAFPAAGRRPFYVLIDCGVLVGTQGAKDRMRQVAESLRDSTGGKIDVLVATHQHWDHVSGFDQVREIFDEIDFGQVWVAWTEDPDNPLARKLRAKRETSLRALHAAGQGLRAAGNERKAESLGNLLGFFGDLAASGGASPVQRAFDYVLGRGNPPRYRTPGEKPIRLRGVDDVKVYVLGPPQNEKLLLRSDPSRRASEVYEKRLALSEETAFFSAVLAAAERQGADLELSSDERELKEISFPFDRVYRVDPEHAKGDEFFRRHYYGATAEPEEESSWRRIDDDWLASADNLALQLDGDTNNTSLALAFELSPGGKVLLFPGDAQVGNWLSWHDPGLQWAGRGEAPVNVADLLRRTVFYKVGHHASHNATLREKGLEMMESPELTAMIPVDEKMARESKGWDMPFGPLYKRLLHKTAGRVLRADRRLPEDLDEEFRQRCDETDLYVELTIPA